MGGVSTLAVATFAGSALAADEAAPIATAAAAVAPAAGQDQPASSSGSGGNTVTEVVVTGLRGSLQKSLNIKRNASGVVDAISSEDIGKFPDSNLAQAMERIPGITVTRGATSLGNVPTSTGEATQITVRGFGPNFNETLFDGRQISSAIGNRSFDFSAVGADFVSEIDVLKTPDATLSAGAIGATVDIKYGKPFDHMGPRVSGSLSGSYSPEDGNPTPSGSLLLSDTFAGDTIGVLFDVAYSDKKTRGNHVDVQGWGGIDTVAPPAPGQTPNGILQSQYAGTAPAIGSHNWFIQDYGIYQEHSEDKRLNGRAVLQWRPASNILITLNDDYSKDDLTNREAGVSWWFNSGSLQNITTSPNGTITSFQQPGTPLDFQGQITRSVIQNNEAGLNVKWDVNSKFKLEFDADHAESWLNPDGELSNEDVDVGYGHGAFNTTNLGLKLSGGMYVPFNYGPGGNASEFNGNFASNGYPTAIGSHVLVLESNQNYDVVNQFKVLGTWTEDHLRIRAGIQYLSDHENLKYYGDFNNSDWQAYAGYGPANGNTGAPLNPAWFTSSFSTAGFINGKSGALPPQIMQFNPSTVMNYLQSLSLPNPYFNTGCNCTYAADGKYAYPLGSRNDINEETLSAFVDFAFDAQVADRPMKVNFGVREDHTRMEASALGHTLTALGTPASSDPTNYITYGLNDPAVTLTKGNNYNYLLPNLDVNYFLTPKLKLRFDASRTLTKPLLSDLSPALSIGTTRLNALTATGGNPSLLPYLSDNIDLGAEWYYQKNSYLSADFFVKDISNFIASGVYTTTFPGVYLPPAADSTFSNHGTQGTSATGPAAVFSVTSKLNEGAYQVRGVELTAQHVFGDTGFGFLANMTLVDSNKPYNPANIGTTTVVPGLANSWNFIGFYDKYGFQARIAVNHTDDELLGLGQHQNVSNYGAEPTFLSAATYVDFSTSYQLTSYLNVYFEALNLTDQIYETHGRYSNQILDQVDTGRRFNLGARFKF
jgi:TonB-dependent receptor